VRFEVDVFFLVVKIVLQDVLLHLNKVFVLKTLTLQVVNNEGHHILCMTTISHFIVTSIGFFPFIHIILVHIFVESLLTNLFVFFHILCMMIPHFAKASTKFFIFPFQLFLFYLAQSFVSFEVCSLLFVFVIRFTILCMFTKNENEVCVLNVNGWNVLVGFLCIL